MATAAALRALRIDDIVVCSGTADEVCAFLDANEPPACATIGPMATAAAADRPIHPMLAALDRAPVGEPWTPEQRAELDQAMADITAGRVQLVAQDDVPAWLEQHAG